MICRYCFNIPDTELVNLGVPGLDFCSHGMVETQVLCFVIASVACLVGKWGQNVAQWVTSPPCKAKQRGIRGGKEYKRARDPHGQAAFPPFLHATPWGTACRAEGLSKPGRGSFQNQSEPSHPAQGSPLPSQRPLSPAAASSAGTRVIALVLGKPLSKQGDKAAPECRLFMCFCIGYCDKKLWIIRWADGNHLPGLCRGCCLNSHSGSSVNLACFTFVSWVQIGTFHGVGRLCTSTWSAFSLSAGALLEAGVLQPLSVLSGASALTWSPIFSECKYKCVLLGFTPLQVLLQLYRRIILVF